MNLVRFAALAGVLACALPAVCTPVSPVGDPRPATSPDPNTPAAPAPGYNSLLESSSLAEPEPAPAAAAAGAADDHLVRSGVRPFSAVAVAIKVGVGGIGFDVATPLARKLNLRGGGEFFSYSPSLTEDGIDVNGSVNFKTVDMHVDFFPFGGSFRLSPGLTLYNGNHLNALATIPGNQTFSLGDGDYYSSPTDPVHGTFDVAFGNKVAPSFTLGFGNMIPRSGKHFSVPFEIGFEYIGAPTITLSLTGTACQQGQPAAVGCQSISTDATTQANIRQEQLDLNSDLSPARFYPIASIGLSYKF